MKQFYKLVLFFLVVAAPVAGVAQSKPGSDTGHSSNDSIRTVCDSIIWYGEKYDATGDYPFTDPITNAPCTLKLTVNYSADTVVYDTTCNVFVWNDSVYLYESGEYTRRFETVHGCDSVVTLHLTMHYSTYNVETETACESFTWHGNTYTTSGTYTFDYNNPDGCASTDTLHLTVNYGTHNVETETACESFTWHGTTYTTSGTYTYSYNNSDSCASTDTLHLTVNYGTHNVDSVTACESYEWHGTTYMEGGTYTYAYENATGCQSVDTLHLTVYPLPEVTIVSTSATDTVCGGGVVLMANGNPDYEYLWNTDETNSWISVDTSGTYYVTATDATTGCINSDSIKITVNQSYYTTVYDTICDSRLPHLWNDVEFGTAGTKTTVLQAANGCDSVVIMSLTVNPVYYLTDTLRICQNELPYSWRDTVFPVGTVSDNIVFPNSSTCGCDSVVTLTLIVDTLPNISIGFALNSDSIICEGRNTILVAKGSEQGGTYIWSNGMNTPSITVSEQNVYTVTFTGTNDCANTAAKTVRVTHPTYGDMIAVACDSLTWNGTSYLQSGNYTVTLSDANAAGCDSIVTLHLTIHHSTHTFDTVSACGSYVWHDSTYSTTGTHTYSYSYWNADSCQNVETLCLTIYNAIDSAVEVTACGRYDWDDGDGQTYTASGTYTYSHLDAHDCWQVDTLYLTVNHPAYGDTTAIKCESFTWYDSTYTVTPEVAPTHTFHSDNPNDCDSTVTLHLTILHGTHNSDTVSACGSYMWHNETYTTSSTYQYEYTDADGCGSVDTLYLTIHNPTHNAIYDTACMSYTWNGGSEETYTTSGNYTHAHEDDHGCWQVDTLHLTINHVTYGDTIAEACESFDWYEHKNITESNYFTHTFVEGNHHRCDSIVTLLLTINHPVHSEISVTECGSYTLNGVTYTTSCDTTQTLTAVNGCDSVVTLHLTINGGMDTTKIVRKNKNQGRETYMLIYPKDSLFYQWYKDEEPILGANGQYYVLDTDTNAQNGCYKVLVTPQTPGACGSFTDTCCVNNPTSHSKTLILPNPNDGQFRLMLPEGTVNVQILDVNGQVVMARKVDGDEMLEMNTGLANGLYFVKTFRTDGSFNTEKLVINR